jgi:hypothetical protein
MRHQHKFIDNVQALLSELSTATIYIDMAVFADQYQRRPAMLWAAEGFNHMPDFLGYFHLKTKSLKR